MNHIKRKILGAFTLLQMLLVIALLALLTAIPRADAADLFTLTRVKAFSNAPTYIYLSAVSNATVTANTYRSNMIPVSLGKGLGLICNFTQTNGQAAAITHYFGLVFNRTNTSSVTNFSWTITPIVNANPQSVWTNIPADVLNNADGVFWFSTQNGNTNTLTGFKLLGQQANQ